jgi:hypothetical protein
MAQLHPIRVKHFPMNSTTIVRTQQRDDQGVPMTELSDELIVDQIQTGG